MLGTLRERARSWAVANRSDLKDGYTTQPDVEIACLNLTLSFGGGPASSSREVEQNAEIWDMLFCGILTRIISSLNSSVTPWLI